MNKELISNFIRDFCAVGKLRAKSEVRKRLNEILKAQREEIVEKIEKKKGRDMPTFDKKVWLELLDKKEIINLINKEDD